MKDTVDSRAVKIAAKIMQADGLCRYDSVEKCRRVYMDEATCERCIRAWLISKAKKELKKEATPRLAAFIGYTPPGERKPAIKTSPKWCPMRPENQKEEKDHE